MEKLTEIANKHNCDKGTKAYEAHGYTKEYAKYIPQEGKYTLLEIGVWHGDSLRMWQEYNRNLVIYGVDIDWAVSNYMNRETDPGVFIGDATDIKFISLIVNGIGIPDFIIDDGSHNYKDIIKTFEILYPRLKDGGIYFIEDLHAQQANRTKTLHDISKLLALNTPKHSRLVCNDKLFIIQK